MNWYKGTVSDGKLKADKRYTVTYKDGEEYDYCIAETKEFIQLQEILIGEKGY